jgi:hypothetical protein
LRFQEVSEVSRELEELKAMCSEAATLSLVALHGDMVLNETDALVVHNPMHLGSLVKQLISNLQASSFWV